MIHNKDKDIEGLCLHTKKTPFCPYENIAAFPREVLPTFKDELEDQLRNGYMRDGCHIKTVYPPISWTGNTRSFSFYLHAWDPINDLIMGFSVFNDVRYIEPALAYAQSWIDTFQRHLLDKTSDEDLDALVKPEMKPEWYDMAVGYRCYRIAYLLDYLIRQEDTPTEKIIVWWKTLLFHFKLLNREHFFRAHNNHGLYQAIGHLAAARRFLHMPPINTEYNVAEERLLSIVQNFFTEEGFHKEHSPGYHYMLMGTFMNIQRCGLLKDSSLKQMAEKIESALPWLTKPDQYLSPFGDTDPRHLRSKKKIAELYQNPHLQYILSEGLIGEAPLQGVGFFPKSGYAFARHAHTTKDMNATAYLAQASCFHSRTHKHADHLTFVWCDYGRDILTDAGRYAYAGKTQKGDPLFEEGFWYADPKRIYCESTRAHNCVVIDGKNYPRKGVKPFGSALVEAYEDQGLFITYSEVRHFQTIRHQRRLIMKPGHFLIVLDWLYNRTETPHEYTQRFLLDAPWQAVRKEGIIKATHTGTIQDSTETLHPLSLCVGTFFDDATVLDGTRGEESPELLGWMSDKPNSLIPACSLGIQATSHGPHGFATLFTFSDSLILHPSTKNTTLTKGSLAWTDDRGTHTLSFHKKEEKVSFSLKSA